MFKTMLWKEYRDGAVIWVALAALGVSTVLAVPAVIELLDLPHDQDNAHIAWLLKVWLWVYGLIAGAMLLAGEREARTLALLDMLQPRRSLLWLSKLFASGLFGLLMGGVFTLVYAGNDWWNDKAVNWISWGTPFEPHFPVLLLLLIALDAIPWGLAASSLCRTVMPAVGLATITFLFSWALSGLFWKSPLMMVGSRLAFDLLALGVSGLVFAQPEPDGAQQSGGFAAFGKLLSPGLGRQRGFFAVQAWLCWRQGRTLILSMMVAAVVSGFLLSPLAPQTWPLGTLLVGILCGLNVWSDEQAGGHYKFLGDGRFPLFRQWLFKTLFWFGVGALVLILAALAGVLSLEVANWHSGRRIRDDGGVFLQYFKQVVNPFLALTLWWFYGFTLAQLTVMIWRKTIVTFVLTFMGALFFVGLWLPSILLGGLPVWQVAIPPALWLVTAAVLLWPWASIGLTGWRQMSLLMACSSLSGLWLVGCLVWRAREIPTTTEPFDSVAFQNRYPTAQQNKAPRDIQVALGITQVSDVPAGGGMVPPPPPPPRVLRPESANEDHLYATLDRGWGHAQQPPQLGTVLDGLFQDRVVEVQVGPANIAQARLEVREAWIEKVDQAARERPVEPLEIGFGVGHVGHGAAVTRVPLGVFDDPSLERQNMSNNLQRLSGMALAMTVRALQLQATNRHEEAVRYLAVVLALSRHARNLAPLTSLQFGVRIERIAQEGIDRMLPRLLRDHPASARTLLAEMNLHHRDSPVIEDNLRAEYLSIAQRINGQSSPLPFELGTDPRHEGSWYNQVLTTSLQTPWERARTERLYQLSYAKSRETLGGPSAPDDTHRYLNKSWLKLHNWQDWNLTRQMNDSLLCRTEGLRLQLALAVYQLDHKQPAPDLAALVPKYLPALPIDPYANKPFGYRVAAKDEKIATAGSDGGGAGELVVPEGQGILWSAGPDRLDNGGKVQIRMPSPNRRNPAAAGDLIFLVPLGQ